MEIREKENQGIKGTVTITLQNVITGKITKETFQNVICDVGKYSWASRCTGADKGFISYVALGTGTNVPGVSDVKLQTEIIRKLISSRSSTDKEANFRTFFTIEEAVANLKEIGLFGDDASDTADSGTLFAHRAITKNKTSSDTLTVDWTITFN